VRNGGRGRMSNKVEDDGDCIRCNATMTVEDGLEPTDICHSCIYVEVDDLRAQLAKAEGDAEAHRLRCASLERQLEASKRAELESDRRAREAEARIAILLPTVEHYASLYGNTRAQEALVALSEVRA
jgi:hypothetical protein